MAKKIDKTINSWCRALLDLGRRNRMIHYRPSKRRSLDITEPNAEILFEKLVHGEKTLTFKRPIDKRSAPRTHAVLSLFQMLGHPIKVSVGDIDYKGDYENAQSALSHMRSSYRLAHEEQGCHILYVSFGFIEWQDGKGGAKGSPYVKSPLVLVPVDLLQDKPSAPFSLKKQGDDIVVNPSLSLAFEKIGISLPGFDEEEETLASYFEKIEAMAEDHGWRVLREASLGLLSFQKISMYRDLEANRARLYENRFVSAMAGEKEVFAPLTPLQPDSISYRDTYRVLPADSSQEEAILAAKRGESFVMEGPPGTGKSQTITNIIAEKLEDGKKVLFVSGKNAALQVVYKRLTETGLARFCLPLHSHRANKREILNDLSESLKIKAPRLSESDERDLLSLDEKRKALNDYRTALHTPIAPLGYTPYECYGALIESNAPILALKTLPQTREETYRLLTLASSYDSERAAFLSSFDRLPTALFGIDPDRADREAITKNLISLGNALVVITREAREAGISLDALSIDAIPSLASLVAEIASLSPNTLSSRKALVKSLRSLGEIRQAAEDKAAVESAFLPTVQTFDRALWLIETETLLRAALRDGVIPLFLDKISPDRLAEQHKTLLPLTQELLALNTALEASLSTLSELLGFPLTRRFDELYGYLSYLPYLDTETFVDPSWNTHTELDFSLFAACKKAASQVIQYEERIVEVWRPNVFELDYKRLKEKFNVNLHGLFGFVSASSRREVKRLLQSYTLDGSLPSDEAISTLFDTLSDRAISLSRFNNRESTLKEAIGSHWRGVRTDFTAIERGFAFLRVLPSTLSQIPAPIAAYLALQREKKKTALDAFQALGKTLTSLKRVFDSVEGLYQKLEDCHNADILLTFAQNRLLAIETAFSGIEKHTKKPLGFDEIKSLLARCDSYEAFVAKGVAALENERFLSALGAMIAFTGSEDALVDLTLSLHQNPHTESLAVTIAHEEKTIGQAIDHLQTVFDGRRFLSNSVKETKKEVASLLEALPMLDRFTPLAAIYRSFALKGMEDTLLLYESLSPDCPFENALRISVLSAALDTAKAERDALKHFSKTKIARTVSTFSSLDKRFTEISRKRIPQKLAKSLPQDDREWRGEDELSVLQHECAKRRGFMPLRKLFGKIPNLLLTLKPCFMMSPLSVSYFLEKESYRFDTVIFDEASQLFPEDAIGAIMRADQVIIVGDSKQLPPTDFFSVKSEQNEEDEEDDEDYTEVKQSILDAANTVLPKAKLLWHYRSRYESLIAFSNHKIYSGELVTFPSPMPDGVDCGIEYLYLPDGIYEPGKGQNQKEAEAAVTMLHEHIIRHGDRSLGIIAFGKKQQKAIEDAVTAFRLDNPQYEEFFSESRDEPFFIKNLENVQGDERDTIIFSIGYGKTQRGKFSMNFGPVTKLGGERRLNVAITRAKENIKLIGSILPSDFNLAATDSEGVHLLRSYIDYALNRSAALTAKKAELSEEADPFLDTVAAFLESEGFVLKKRFGTSLCRVELAVFHPAHRAAIAALMTDGEGYRRTPAACDREHLRFAMLEKSGWRVYRLYAPAWLSDFEKERAALLDFLKNSQNEQSEIEATPVSIDSADEDVTTDGASTDATAALPYNFAPYRAADWARAPLSDPCDKEAVVRDRMLYLIEEEAPIHRDALFRRLATSFKSGKLTESVKKSLESALLSLGERVRVDLSGFVFLKDEKAPTVRIPTDAAESRPFEYVSKEELAEAIPVILQSVFGATPNELYHELARVYGIERMSDKVQKRCEEALFLLLLQERVRLLDGKIKLL